MTLMIMLARYDQVMEIMLPTLREERRKTYAPFPPVHPEDRRRHGKSRSTVNDAAKARRTDPDTGERFET